MRTSASTPLTGEIWHLTIDDLLAPLPETLRLGGPGPFVINLSASTAPISLPMKSITERADVHLYQIQRTEDRRVRYRLRLGPFDREDDAEAVLAAVREIYPSALTATAETDDLKAIESMKAKAEAQHAARSAAKPSSPPPVSSPSSDVAESETKPRLPEEGALPSTPPPAWVALMASTSSMKAWSPAGRVGPQPSARSPSAPLPTAPAPLAPRATPAPATVSAGTGPAAVATTEALVTSVPTAASVVVSPSAAAPAFTLAPAPEAASATEPVATTVPVPAASSATSPAAPKALAPPARSAAEIDLAAIPVLSDFVEVPRAAAPPLNVRPVSVPTAQPAPSSAVRPLPSPSTHAVPPPAAHPVSSPSTHPAPGREMHPATVLETAPLSVLETSPPAQAPQAAAPIIELELELDTWAPAAPVATVPAVESVAAEPAPTLKTAAPAVDSSLHAKPASPADDKPTPAVKPVASAAHAEPTMTAVDKPAPTVKHVASAADKLVHAEPTTPAADKPMPVVSPAVKPVVAAADKLAHAESAAPAAIKSAPAANKPAPAINPASTINPAPTIKPPAMFIGGKLTYPKPVSPAIEKLAHSGFSMSPVKPTASAAKSMTTAIEPRTANSAVPALKPTQPIAKPAVPTKPAAPTAAPVAPAAGLAGTRTVTAASAPPERKAAALATSIPNFETTQTLRPLTAVELQDGKALRWFAIQLAQSDESFDPEALPNLDIFSEYRLYSVAALDEGRVVHALRVGFFTEQSAAAAVAGYLASFYEKPVVKRISVAERTRFSDQRVEARKDIGATGRHAIIEITDERVVRAKRTPAAIVTPIARPVPAAAASKTR
jgi:hypothetical protein